MEEAVIIGIPILMAISVTWFIIIEERRDKRMYK
jgi:hypothetical protein